MSIKNFALVSLLLTSTLTAQVSFVDVESRQAAMGGYDELAGTIHFALDPAYPNPFNPSTNLSYQLPEAASVQFAAFDVLGRRVWRHDTDEQPMGRYTLTFDGAGLASGLYVVCMTAGSSSQTRAIILVK